jgi:hypothetical protein
MKNIISILVVIVLIILYMFFGVKVFPQEPQGLNATVSPTVIEVSDAPGDTITGKFRLRNNQADPLSLTIHVDKLNPTEDGRVSPATPRSEDTYISWLEFNKNTFTAPAREWTDISYTLKIPNEAAFGYYYAIRITQNAKTQTSTNTTVLGEIVIPLLLEVKKDGAKREVKLIDFKADQSINEYLPVSFTTTVENTGNIHSKPRGNIFIRSSSGHDISLLEVNEGLGSVLPASKRSFTSLWADGFLVKGEDGLKINWNKLTDFRIGKYTANLLLVYDSGQRDIALEKSTSFWVIPYTALAVIAITLVILFFIIRFLLKLYIKNQISKIKSQR